MGAIFPNTVLNIIHYWGICLCGEKAEQYSFRWLSIYVPSPDLAIFSQSPQLQLQAGYWDMPFFILWNKAFYAF